MVLINVSPGNTKIDFIGKKSVAFVLSIILIVGSFGLLLTKGLNFGIDFTGGIVIEIRSEQEIQISTLRPVLANAGLGEIALQNIGSENDIMIRVQGDGGDKAETVAKIKTILEKNLSDKLDYRKVDYVGPQIGEELIETGLIALFLAFLAIMIYIWMRFEWQFSISAILALIHDVIVTLGLYSFMGLEFNLTSIAAILIIIGYSINDSVVIFDRIRENLRKFKKTALPEILNNSINDNLTRTILTSGTTIASLIALVTLGGDVIHGFSIAVLFGIVVGTYSSMYIASPLLVYMNLRNEKPSS